MKYKDNYIKVYDGMGSERLINGSNVFETLLQFGQTRVDLY